VWEKDSSRIHMVRVNHAGEYPAEEPFLFLVKFFNKWFSTIPGDFNLEIVGGFVDGDLKP